MTDKNDYLDGRRGGDVWASMKDKMVYVEVGGSRATRAVTAMSWQIGWRKFAFQQAAKGWSTGMKMTRSPISGIVVVIVDEAPGARTGRKRGASKATT